MRSFAVFAVLSFAASACGVAPGDGGLAAAGFGLAFAPEAGDGCAPSVAGTHRLPPDVSWLVARVLDESGAEVAATTMGQEDIDDGAGSALIRGVTPGVWTVEVTGCSEGGKATWRGSTPGVAVTAHSKATPLVFMLPAGRFACIGGLNLNPLTSFDGDDFLHEGRSAFGAAAVTPSGRVILAGGGRDLRKDDRLAGDTAVWEFRRDAGVFTRVQGASGTRAALSESRLMHGLVALDDDRLVAAGGAASVILSSQYPGAMPPVRPERAPVAPLEVLSLASGTAEPISVPAAGGSWTAAAPAWAWSKDGRLALAGGLAGGSPVDLVVFVDPAKPSEASAGKLSSPRFGGAARFLSTGELLVVGGWTGSQAAPPELVRVDEQGNVVSTPLAGTLPPAGVAPTAFPFAEVVADDGLKAVVLILSGNPVGNYTVKGYNRPDRANAWTLTLSGDGDAYDPASANATVVEVDPAAEWPLRSLVSVSRFGEGWLVAGGFQAFSKTEFADCKDGQGKDLPYCFPRSVAMIMPPAVGAGIGSVETVRLPHGRLGVTTVALDRDQVLLIGGIGGYGLTGPDAYDWKAPDAPSPWSSPADWVLSSGVVAVRAGAFDGGDVCAAHPRPAPVQ